MNASRARYEHDANDSLPVLTAKLYRPPVAPDLEVRTGLIGRLNQNRHRPLTLISAPAGYGKSTLASMWLEQCDCASAWISLDESDSALRTFLMYVLVAVQGAFPGAELKTRYPLNAPSLPPHADLARYLLNDLEEIGEPLILALDDLHLVHGQVVHDLLTDLLRHPLPTLQLVLISRRDPPLPLATMRGRGQVTEIRARDLCFSVSETARLLEKRLGRDVDDTIAAEWTAKTEGWVTAIHLATLALRYRNMEDVRVNFEGDSIFLQDYLMAEVVSNLSPDRQEWLLSASLLDRFCAPLCEAVSGKDVSGAESEMTGEGFIQWLQGSNLFVIPVDGERVWFRLHHLFQEILQDALRKRCDVGTIAAYHRRASCWFAENNLLDEGIRHAIAGGDIDTAVRIITDHRYDLMNNEQWERLDTWIQSLPKEVVQTSLVLTSTRGILGFELLRDSELRDSLRRAQELLDSTSLDESVCRAVIGEMTVLRGLVTVYTGTATGDELYKLGRRALDMLPSNANHLRILAIGMMLFGEQMKGEFGRGKGLFEEALSSYEWPPTFRLLLMYMWSLACFMDGDLGAALRHSAECLRLSEEYHLPYTLNGARQYLGVSYYLRNDLDLAEPLLESLADAWPVSPPSYVLYGNFALALIRLAQDRRTDAERLVDQLVDHYPPSGKQAAARIAQACQIELQIRMGDIAQARHMSAGFDFDFRPPLWVFLAHQLTPIKLLLAEGTASSLASARESLEALDAQMQSIHRNSVRIDALALLSITCDAQGDNATASEKLVEALKLGKRGGHIRNFVDLGPLMQDLLTRLRQELEGAQQALAPHIDRILAAFPAQGQARPNSNSHHAPRQSTLSMSEMDEPLTERELQVLRLLATELTPTEIADQLVVSVGTVRTHTKNIYFKLDVHSRPEAVHRGRERSLISSP